MKKNDRPLFIYFNVSFCKKYNPTNYQYMQGCNLFMTTGLENDRVLYKKNTTNRPGSGHDNWLNISIKHAVKKRLKKLIDKNYCTKYSFYLRSIH